MPPGGHPTKLFINYRREDTAPYAGRLYDRLVAHFGEDQVFMDIDQIEPGEDFVEVIDRKVGACEIAIISIGPKWLSVTDATGQRRLDDSEDLVRIEILAALERKIRVIPVLVGGASMPRRQDLPEALAPLSRRNAIELSEMRFHADVSRLIEAIEKTRAFPEKKTETLPSPIVSPSEPVSPKSADPENLLKTTALRPPAEPPLGPVAPIAEPAPLEKLPDPVNAPNTSAILASAEAPPVPVAHIAESAQPVKLPAPENLPETSAPRLPAGQTQTPNRPTAPRSQTAAATAEKRRLAWLLGDLAPRSQPRPATAPPVKLPLPENLPKTSAPPPPAVLNQPASPLPAPRAQARPDTTKKRKMPSWIFVFFGCFALLLCVVIFVIVPFVANLGRAMDQSVSVSPQTEGYGKRLEYNGGELEYNSTVTDAEARKLGEYLVKIEHFDGKPKTVQLNKTGTSYEFRVCIKEGVELTDSNTAYYKTLGQKISLNVFDGRPVVVHLCDKNMKTRYVIFPAAKLSKGPGQLYHTRRPEFRRSQRSRIASPSSATFRLMFNDGNRVTALSWVVSNSPAVQYSENASSG